MIKGQVPLNMCFSKKRDGEVVTNLEFRISLHQLQNNVAANGVAHQDQAGFSGNMFPEEGQLVFNLPVETKYITLCC